MHIYRKLTVGGTRQRLAQSLRRQVGRSDRIIQGVMTLTV
jgi:hypothetical protein